jgi:hypothetical protein
MKILILDFINKKNVSLDFLDRINLFVKELFFKKNKQQYSKEV